MQLTFEQLPEAVSLILQKLNAIERLIEKKDSKTEKEGDALLVIAEASEFLHLALPTIYALVSRRQIPFMKKGKRLYFSKKALTDWLIKTEREAIS